MSCSKAAYAGFHWRAFQRASACCRVCAGRTSASNGTAAKSFGNCFTWPPSVANPSPFEGPLAFGKFQQKLCELLLVRVSWHRGLIVLQLVDCLFDLFLPIEQ